MSVLPGWRAKVAQVITGTANAKILCVGDSTTWGHEGGGLNPPFLTSWPAVLAGLLNTSYVPTIKGMSAYGNAGDGTPDTRWTLGTGWSQSTRGDTVGFTNLCVKGASGAAGTCAFAPGINCDRADIYYATTPALGTSAVSVDGGASTNLVGAAALGIAKTTISFTAGSAHTISFAGPSGGTFYLIGIEPYLSTAKNVRVALTGVSSSTTNLWIDSTNPFSSIGCIEAYAPDLSILMLGINDARVDSLTSGQWVTKTQTLITACQASGEVLVVTVVPSGDGSAPLESQYATAAQTLGVPVLDLFNNTFVSYANANGNGWMADTLHPNGAGYAKIAQTIYADIGSPFAKGVTDLGAVGYWRLGESSGSVTTDITGNQNGVYTNTSGITYSQVGVSNDGDTGIVLDGDTNKGYVAVADNAAQHVGDTFTMGLVARVDYLGDVFTVLFGSAAANGPQIILNSDGTVCVGKDGAAFITQTSTQKLNDGLKHLVVWTKNGATNKLYFDRGVDVTGSVVNATISNAVGYNIGRNRSASTTEYFGGFLDEVFLLPTALSQGQVQALYDLAFMYTAAPVPSVARGASTASLAAGTTNLTPSSTAYQWRRNGSNIGAATATSYTFVSSDYGKDVDVVAAATSAAGFTTEQASPVALSPSANGTSFTRGVKPLLLGTDPVGSITSYWEPCVMLDATNSRYVLFADLATGPGFNTTGLGRWTCPYASDATLAASWTYTGKVIATTVTGSPTIIDQGTSWRIYYYKATPTSALYTRTSSDKGATWGSETTAVAANAVGYAKGWAGTTAWPTNGDPTSANWEMLIEGIVNPSTTAYGMTYAKSTDSGATYTIQNAGFYTTLAVSGSGEAGGGPCVLNGGAKANNRYYILCHVSSTVGAATPTDIILAYSTDLTADAWTVVGHMLDHNPSSNYANLQVADPWLVEQGGSTYLFHSAVRSYDEAGSVQVASYPGTTAQFLGLAAATKIPIDSFAYGTKVYARDQTYPSTDAAVTAVPQLFIDAGGAKTATTSFVFRDTTLGRDRAIWAGDKVAMSDNAYIAAPGFFT